MAEIVNLRRARKQRKRTDADKQAEQNRISFGCSKAERALSDAEAALAAKRLEGHRLSSSDDGESG